MRGSRSSPASGGSSSSIADHRTVNALRATKPAMNEPTMLKGVKRSLDRPLRLIHYWLWTVVTSVGMEARRVGDGSSGFQPSLE